MAAQSAEAEATRRADVAKTALLHAISHDLRSPLTAITTAASALAARPRPTREDRQALIEAIEAESARLARLVDDLLDLSRIEAGAVNPRTDWCDLGDVAGAAPRRRRRRAGEHPIELDLPADLPLVRADAAQLERVFSNLLENAIKFSPDGAPVRVSGGPGGGRVTVRVTDRGRGVPRAKRAEIFEPFVRGRDDGQGSGLGLAICRGFVEANGGEIRLQSATGQGTTFAVSFPARPPARGGAVSAEDERRILVVDDEPQIVRGLKVILRGAGYSTDAAEPRRRRSTPSRCARPTRWSSTSCFRTGAASTSAREVRQLEQPADHRPLGGRRRAREGPGARRRRRRLHHQAVRDRRAARAPARGAATGRARTAASRRSTLGDLVIDLAGADGDARTARRST